MKDLVEKKENKPDKEKVKVNLSMNVGKAFKLDILIVSLVVVLFGALFVSFPTESLDILCYAFGIAMCVGGVVSMISYFLSSKVALFDSYGLVRGIALLALGIVVLANPKEVASLFISIFGALIIVDGALKLQYSVDLIRIKERGFKVLMPIAFLVIVFGGAIIFDPFGDTDKQMFWTGIAMIIDGICDIAVVVYLYTVISKLKKGDGKDE